MKLNILYRPLAALALVLAACGEGGGGPGPEILPPASLQKAGGDAQSGPAGSALADSLGVRVLNNIGNGVAGVPVFFSTGAGEMSAGQVVTDAQGYARSRLTLGGRPGVDTVFAGVPGAAALGQVKFVVTITPGGAATLVRVEGDAQTASVGQPVFVAPMVRVEDAFGNPLGGVTVIFTPQPGSGTVTGGTVTSDPLGRARVASWVLGQEGANRLDVSAGAAATTFTATGSGACTQVAYTLFTTIERQLSLGCSVEARPAQPFSITLPADGVDFSVVSQAFTPSVGLLDASGRGLGWSQTFSADSAYLRVYAPAGSYGLAAAMASPTSGGTYRLRSSLAAGAPRCSPALVVPGVAILSTVQALGCGMELQNRYRISAVQVGQPLRVTLTSTAFNPRIVVRDQHGNDYVSATGTGPGSTATVTVTAGNFPPYTVDVTPEGGATGDYTLVIERQ